jgi:hypothetical protein
MRASRSEPTIKVSRYNIGNGYGQYCVLDDPPIKPKLSPRCSDKIKIKIVTPNSSDSELSETESPNIDKKNNEPTTRIKVFLAGVYLTAAAVIAFEYWYCFKPMKI